MGQGWLFEKRFLFFKKIAAHVVAVEVEVKKGCPL